ncbi:MAG: hypothetical protein KF871_16595 [Hydrogenophaga sp.]|uniref:hypothetical protein n=1 Tax=Hydrogenophaga sp. TaxID=1904254 RepID=UPI001DEB0840|nr:hypothetical protein [Hydrogenophaga sp.]MBX3611514.1 hypothetical protein [Hydrogenophaga sp.]
MPACHWVCRYPDTLALKVWSEGAVVYDATDASLHALTPVGGDIMQALLDGFPHDAGSLAAELLGEAPTSSDVDQVVRQLAQFEHLGLIERLQST